MAPRRVTRIPKEDIVIPVGIQDSPPLQLDGVGAELPMRHPQEPIFNTGGIIVSSAGLDVCVGGGGEEEAFAALRRDLIHEDGPRISTMRNYRFAIVQYEPKHEFMLRAEVQRLSSDLVANGWMVLSINLQKLLFDRVRQQGAEWVARVGEMERRMAAIEPSIKLKIRLLRSASRSRDSGTTTS